MSLQLTPSSAPSHDSSQASSVALALPSTQACHSQPLSLSGLQITFSNASTRISNSVTPLLQLSGTTLPSTQDTVMTATQVSSLTASPADPSKTDPIKGNKRNLQWTGAMEKAALKLYAKAVLAGRKSDGGFKAEVHQEVATKLNKQFPGSDFTVKRSARGFGWDEVRSEVTASKEVWDLFLVSHPHARRFRNTPFPEYYELQIIFGSLATGENSMSLSQRATDSGPRNARHQSGSDTSSGEDKPCGSPSKPPARKRNPQTSGDALAGAIKDLIGAFAPPPGTQASSVLAPIPEAPSQLISATALQAIHQSDEQAINEAVNVFQTQIADTLEMDDLVAGFGVLESASKSRLFLRIANNYKGPWLRNEIEKHKQAK
ncbi:hypothetical protein PCASD_12180 [Puccinia coronata f. sp. avenae]|uniref:Myb/SANT-like domain-containing protein n=1 Tax=Puccinia coronata f. sp. avenae TaxID=200324 RepID=A0A2N5UIW0_9BASI|nr:hypothetical protein PCASD_12180 [Puccinia coronata f. sp. avenae]